MRLLSLSFRGLYAFPDRVDVDLQDLGVGLVALVGKNGAGKTTTMEAAPASIWGAFPSRPGFYENFVGKDCYIESVWNDGAEEIKLRIVVDAEKRKTERYVLVNGEAVTSGKAAAFQEEVERRFGSYELFLASVFSCQTKAGSFLTAPRAKRKEMFAEMLGLSRLEADALAAKEQRAKWDGILEQRRGAAVTLEDDLAWLPGAREAWDGAVHASALAGADLEAKRTAEASATQVLERARSAGERIAALVSAEESARTALLSATRTLDDAKREPAKAQARAGERAKAVHDRHVEKLESGIRERHGQALRVLDARAASLGEALVGLVDLEDARGKLERCTGEIESAEKSEELEARSRKAHDAARLEAERERTSVQGLINERVRELERLDGQTGRLGQVPCTKQRAWLTGSEGIAGLDTRLVDLAETCPLLADAREAKAKEEALLLVPVDTTQSSAKTEKARGLLEDLGLLEDPTRPGRLVSLRRDEAALRADIAKAEGASLLRTQLDSIPEERRLLERQAGLELAEARKESQAAKDDLAQIEEDLEAALLEAEERVRAAREAFTGAQGRYDEASRALVVARSEVVEVTQAEAHLRSAVSDREDAEKAARAADQEVANTKARLDQLLMLEGKLEPAREQVREAEREFGDWKLIEVGCGKNGAQALKMDAASPEISAIANELLSTCYDGKQVSIQITTQREKVSGGFEEDFDVLVFKGGKPCSIEAISGGEKVVVGEGIGGAIAVSNARKSGVRWKTAWRDETAGSLDPENARAYLVMLRRMRELGGFEQLLFIAHQEELWQSADARLFVAGGKVTTEERRLAA